jgi:hypothetical protein
MDVCVVCCTYRQKAKCRTIQTKKQIRMKYEKSTREYKKDSWQGQAILAAFAKLPKTTINFVISVSPAVRMEQLGSNLTSFYEILYLRFFRKSVEKGQFSLKSDKKNGHFTSRIVYASVMVSRLFFPKIKQFSDESYIENLNTNFMLTTIFVKIVSFMR